MTLHWVLGWWNLLFVVPFGIALTYLAVYVTTGVTFGDADHDFDADHDLDADHDVDGDHDGDAHDADDADGHDADDQHDDDAGRAHASILSLVGVGRVPLSLLLMIALFVWGISGFAAVQWLHQTSVDGARIAAIAVPFAAVVTIVLTAVLARLFGKLMPMHEPASVGRRDLVGRPGVAILDITDTFGLARVSPADGAAAVQVPCRVAGGQSTIASHAPVVVLRFDRDDQLFYVTTPERLDAFRADVIRAVNPGPMPR